MKKISIFFVLLFGLSSCVIPKRLYDLNYKGEPNHKNFYVVDTIQIEDPVVIYFRGRFVCSRKILNSPNLKFDKKFFKRPDVFIFSNNLGYDLDNIIEDYFKYPYPDYGNCSIEMKFQILKNDKNDKNVIYLREFKNQPAYFILGLINANYYNMKHADIEGGWHPIYSKDPKISYYRIVYPLCEDNK